MIFLIFAVIFSITFEASVSIERGVGLATRTCSDALLLNVSWFYTWLDTDPCPGQINIPWYPMIFGAANVADASKFKGSKYEYLLGFNEPNEPNQGNLTPEQALEYWPQLMATGLKLVSPAVAQWNDGPWTWTVPFMNGIKEKGYKVDVLAFHYYGDYRLPSNDMANFFKNITTTFPGYPIWITETSNETGSQPDNVQFLADLYDIFKEYPQIERFSWFTNRWNGPYDNNGSNLVISDGSGLTQTGKAYVKYPKN